jgi:hypothetical protein
MHRIPSKVDAASMGGQLVTLGHSMVGTLDQVMELWRYPSAEACMRWVAQSCMHDVWLLTCHAVHEVHGTFRHEHTRFVPHV